MSNPGPGSATRPVSGSNPQRSCYGVQVLVAGRRKRWRDDVSAQVRRAGFSATTCDSGVDAMTVLVLGLPMDVLVIDTAMKGAVCCTHLAVEARALRPGLRIIFASDLPESGLPENELPEGDLSEDDEALSAGSLTPDALLAPAAIREGTVAGTVREVLRGRC